MTRLYTEGMTLYEQAVLYAWCRDMLPLVREGGVLATTEPGPLTRREIGDVLRLVQCVPEYRCQTVLVHARDGHVVRLKGC